MPDSVDADISTDLQRTRRFCGGLRRDIRRRLIPHYKSDWTDAFTDGNLQKTTACIAFLFFACLSPAITFGAMYENDTNFNMGVSETLLASSIAGITYSLLCGQPLCILGGTGPNLAYTVGFYKLCNVLDVDFLPARVWQGLWCSLFTVILALTDASSLMQYCTRFTEDIFSALISVIFIVGALEQIFDAFRTKDTAGALLTACLAFGTYLLAVTLRDLKKTKWLTSGLRYTISNFAVSLSIVAMSGIAQAFPKNVDIDWLAAPDRLQPSFQVGSNPRPWIIDPLGGQGLNPERKIRALPTWAIFAAIFPGIGMALLNYLDQNLTALLINRPSSARKKPAGYHLDLFVLGAVIYPIVSILGLPFPCAATVRSVAHQNALTTFDDKRIPGGGTQRVATKVIETRWTHFAIHALMAFSTLFGPLLRNIPKAVLFGVFLYMGISSMPGNQFFERIFLWGIWNTRDYPKYDYIIHLPIKRVHLFTAIQTGCFIILYLLKDNKDTSVGFPFFIAGLIVLRRFFGRIFTQNELEDLDGNELMPKSSTAGADPEKVEESKTTESCVQQSEENAKAAIVLEATQSSECDESIIAPESPTTPSAAFGPSHKSEL
eukprot:TRINITY_DN41917_c0_g1_i1.p1 TRINITY_DN41917_c0_g1~~TRINITY_DN41917_c0_g1_i1.p1  ORF type:complete len:605 (-),score=58.06 TRINITY_DN41917_c0_g1_i1:108-1922(-)